MPIETLWVDSFDNNIIDWSMTGANPYLNNSSLNWIDTDTINKHHRHFGFANSAIGAGVINGVNLKCECLCTFVGPFGGFEVLFYLWDGSVWWSLGKRWFPFSYGYLIFNVNIVLNTWAKINAARLWVKSVTEVGTSVAFIRRGKLEVDYTVEIEAQAGLHPSKVMPLLINGNP